MLPWLKEEIERTSLTVARLAWVVAVGAARTCPDRRPATAMIHLRLVIVENERRAKDYSWNKEKEGKRR